MNLVMISFLKLAFFARLFAVDCQDDTYEMENQFDAESEIVKPKQNDSSTCSRQRRKEQDEMLKNFESKRRMEQDGQREFVTCGQEGISTAADRQNDRKKWRPLSNCMRCAGDT